MKKGPVRTSKFRHVFGKSVKKEEQYEDIMPGTSAPDSNLCDVNTKYFGLPWRGGGGPFVIWPLHKTGRLPKDTPLMSGHGGPVMDLAFSPFQDEVIASASDDTTVKVWDFPVDGPTQDIIVSNLTLTGHTKKVILVRWNPIASNVLASVAFDQNIKLWDVSRGQEASSYNDHPEAVQAIDWNHDGSKYITYSKDKNVRIIDPRNNQATAQFDAGHQGTKGAKVSFLGNRPLFATVGFSKQSERQLFIWDQRNTSKSAYELQIDVASGTLIPFFDPDTNLLFLAGKGDTNIRYFEIEDTEPYQYYVDQFGAKEPQRGICMAPKRSLDVSNCEIARFMRLTQNGLEPVSFTVPRKGDHFQDDLYPDTFAGVASMTSSEWLEGQNSTPILISMRPGTTATTGGAKGASQAVDLGGSAVLAGAVAVGHVVPQEQSFQVAQRVQQAAEKATERASGDIARLESRVAQLEEENRRLRLQADGADRLRQHVEELEGHKARLERQIAKMG